MVNRHKWQFLSLGILFLFFSISYPALAVEKFIKYFPSNENIESVEKSYTGKVLGEITCQAAADYFQRIAKCEYCLYTLKAGCPDCCLDFNAGGASRCTVEADPIYNCLPYAFSASDCSQVICTSSLLTDCRSHKIDLIPYCQREGCPSADFEPRIGKGDNCKEYNGDWYCTDNDFIPEDRGCRPISSTIISGYNSKYHSSSNAYDYYDVTEFSSCPVELSKKWNGNDECYRYIPKSTYSNYVTNCRNYTNLTESCFKAADCCNQTVCLDSGSGPGFDINCNEGVCEDRRDWNETIEISDGVEKTCEQIAPSDCIYLQSLAEGCLLDIGGGSCSECFREIDNSLYYKFVAKSGESIVVFWQIIADPIISGDADTYFYTMVKIIDEQGSPIHQSVAHQKAFKGSFSIFSATSIDASEKLLEQSKTYYARIYYFIPEIEETLSMDLKQVQLIIVRTRE